MAKLLTRRVESAVALALALIAVLAASVARAADADGLAMQFAPTGVPHSFKLAPGVHEYVYTARRGPSRFDQVALHRVTGVASASHRSAPVVLYLPGTWMNGAVAPADPRYSLALYLAAHGVDFWALDYRTHFVPPELPQADLAEMKNWSNAAFGDDIAAAAQFVFATTGRRRIVVAGFSRGVEFAYLYAAAHRDSVAGLMMFDGYIWPPSAGAPPAKINAWDVAGKHLTWDKRDALLRLVIENPNAPAPLPQYKDAADNLDHVVYGSADFDGKGGLANPFGGFADASVLAPVLLALDRYWPAVQDYGEPFTPDLKEALHHSQIPVLAFSSTNIAADWPAKVRASASSTGSADVAVKQLDGWGHLDIICGTHAE
jgi:pimeloyl-ACP methyl ester carboxylesterase